MRRSVRSQAKGAHPSQKAVPSRAEPGVQRNRGDAETGRAQDAIGRDPRPEIKGTVDEQGEDPGQGPEGDADTQ